MKKTLLAVATITGAFAGGGFHANAAVIYSQPFYMSGSADRPASDFGWTALVDTDSAGVVDYVHSASTTAAGIGRSTGSSNDPGKVNATTYATGPTTAGYAYYAPKADGNVSAGAHALYSTGEVPDVPVTEITSIAFEQRNDNTNSVMHAAIKIGSQWYASATDFGGQNATWTSKSLAPADFAAAGNWNLLTVTTGGAGQIALGAAAASDLTGTITDMGLYIDSGTTPQSGDHARFDNFVVSKSFDVVDEDFEGETGLPTGWTLVDNTSGTPVFSIVTGHDGSGGGSGSAGHIDGTYDPGANSTPGGWFQSPASRTGASPFTLTYDVKVEQEGDADDSIVVFGDIDSDDYYVLYVTEVDANNDLYRVDNGVRAGSPVEDAYASGILDDTWYSATVVWTPISGTTGTLSVDVVDPGTSTSMGSFTQTNLVMDSTVQFGFGSFNDQASFDNININININVIPEPSTFALAALGLLGLTACGLGRYVRRRRKA